MYALTGHERTTTGKRGGALAAQTGSPLSVSPLTSP